MRKILPLFPLLLLACELDITRLHGSWKAVAYYQNGQSLEAPLDSVGLVFAPTGQYEFRTIGFYREKGPFRVSGTRLFLIDTTEQPAKEHVLNVLFLSSDTLKIQMKKGGHEQVLFFKKN